MQRGEKEDEQSARSPRIYTHRLAVYLEKGQRKEGKEEATGISLDLLERGWMDGGSRVRSSQQNVGGEAGKRGGGVCSAQDIHSWTDAPAILFFFISPPSFQSPALTLSS